jgi:signal transduction histidine kinase
VSNSIKFTPKNGEVGISISVESQDDVAIANTLIIHVNDTGTGMSEAKRLEILSGNVASVAGTEGERGYGFGLSLVMHLIEKAKGSLDIKSKVGEGTRFEVRLPI